MRLIITDALYWRRCILDSADRKPRAYLKKEAVLPQTMKRVQMLQLGWNVENDEEQEVRNAEAKKAGSEMATA